MSSVSVQREKFLKRSQRSLIDILQDNANVAQMQYRMLVNEHKDKVKTIWQFKGERKLIGQEIVDYDYKDKWGFVYLMYFGMGNIYKIGVSKNPVNRLGIFKDVLSPFEMRIEHLIESDDVWFVEESLHEFFIQKNLRGEWFTLDHDDIELIKGLKGIYIYKEVNDVREEIPA